MSERELVKSLTYTPDESKEPTTFLLAAISEHEDSDISELPPLYEYVDPECVNNLFDPPRSIKNGLKRGKLDFEYSQYKITFHSEGTIELREN